MYRKANNGTLGGFTPGQWYSFEYILDYSKGGEGCKNIHITKTDPSGTTLVKEYTEPNLPNTTSVNYFIAQAYSASSNAYFDNFEISYVVEEPSVSEADVSLYAGDVAVANKTEASPRVDKICINLNAALDEKSLENQVTLKDVYGNDVAFDGDVDGTTYVMTLIGNLTEDTSYTLTVGKKHCNSSWRNFR